MTGKEDVMAEDVKIAQAERNISPCETCNPLMEEIVSILKDNLRAKEEMVRALTKVGVSQEAAERLLYLDKKEEWRDKD